jgi:dihydroorotase
VPYNKKIAIINGHLIDPKNNIDEPKNLYIADQQIVGIGNPPDGFNADKTIDANNLIICPGFIDLSVRLQQPNIEYRSTQMEEVKASTASGITTLCCPPDTSNTIDSPAIVDMMKRCSTESGGTKILPIGALTTELDGRHLTEMATLKKAGCIAVSNGIHPMSNTLIQRRAMEYASTHNLTVFIHAEDPHLKNQGCVHEGMISTRLGLPGIPATAEIVAVATDLALAEEVQVKIHFCRISSAKSVEMISHARANGLNVTTDVSINHLHLTEYDIIDFNTNCHTIPPLRTQRDKDQLKQYLKNGDIQAICSNHSPLSEDAKLAPFPETVPGISGLDSYLPLALKLVENNSLDLFTLINRLSYNPAQILQIPTGHLSINAPADICIFDPEMIWQLTPETMNSVGHNTPYMNWELKGKVIWTLVNGQIAYQYKTQ